MDITVTRPSWAQGPTGAHILRTAVRDVAPHGSKVTSVTRDTVTASLRVPVHGAPFARPEHDWAADEACDVLARVWTVGSRDTEPLPPRAQLDVNVRAGMWAARSG